MQEQLLQQLLRQLQYPTAATTAAATAVCNHKCCNSNCLENQVRNINNTKRCNNVLVYSTKDRGQRWSQRYQMDVKYCRSRIHQNISTFDMSAGFTMLTCVIKTSYSATVHTLHNVFIGVSQAAHKTLRSVVNVRATKSGWAPVFVSVPCSKIWAHTCKPCQMLQLPHSSSYCWNYCNCCYNCCNGCNNCCNCNIRNVNNTREEYIHAIMCCYVTKNWDQRWPNGIAGM